MVKGIGRSFLGYKYCAKANTCCLVLNKPEFGVLNFDIRYKFR